jgi:hypothetical protein
MRNYTAVLARLKTLARSTCAEFIVDAAVHSIPKTHLIGAFNDALAGISTRDADIVSSATSSKGAGQLCRLFHMIDGDEQA